MIRAVIDKLDLRVPGGTPFTESFGRLYGRMSWDAKRWRKSQYYSASASFDDCGLDVLLHMHCTMGDKDIHKMEILRSGEKTYAEMVHLCGRVFDCDPERLGIMRVDLTADVADVPVDWFKRHTLVQAKQTRREIGSVQTYQTVTKGRAETLYAGVKPNQIRIYDKVAERRMQYGKYLQKFHRMSAENGFAESLQPTSFEAMYGHNDAATITRVERQVAARDIEKMGLVTLKSLTRADLLDPFKKMLFFDSPRFDERIEDWGFTDWCVGMHLQQRVRELGYSETYSWLRAQHGKNFDRAKKKYAAFLRVPDNVVSIDAARLRNEYRQSSYRQLQPAWAA